MYSPAKSFSSDGFDVKTLKPGYMTYTFDAVSLAHLIHHPPPSLSQQLLLTQFVNKFM